MRLLWIGIVMFASASVAESQAIASTNNAPCAWTNDEKPIPFSQSLQAAASGSPFCQYMLGWRYENGVGVESDYVKAANWYLKASEQGFAAAQWSLGLFYAENKGVPQNFEKAYFWLSLASSAYSAGSEQPLRERVLADRKSVARHLTNSKVIEAQELTEQFLRTHPKSF